MRFSKQIFADGFERLLTRRCLGCAAAALVTIVFGITANRIVVAQQSTSPHLDPDHGVKRIANPSTPTGSCNQCHDEHALASGEAPFPKALYTENANTLCYTEGGAGPCHQAMPTNYPADETSRIPEGFPEAGYFEYNSGGEKIHGARLRSRWPGQIVYDNPTQFGLQYVSPHRSDPEMPRIDPQGVGSCLNCHNPHGSTNPFDMLVGEYRGIGGFAEPTYPSRYGLCFSCHSTFGPPAMEATGRRIADYYDSSINIDERAGHQIQMNPTVALAWPSHVQKGDKLPCYDCHGVHGSRGYNGEGPNTYLISDQRPGWSNLVDTKRDAGQNRRFCLGCHIPSDGIPGSQRVEGIVMNTLSSQAGHASIDLQGCFECHGNDYSTSTSYNVHHPGSGTP